MRIITAKVIDQMPRARIQISVPESDDELQDWRELARRNAQNACAEEDAIYDPDEQPCIRDHTAFLNGSAPEDEGLYDDNLAR